MGLEQVPIEKYPKHTIYHLYNKKELDRIMVSDRAEKGSGVLFNRVAFHQCKLSV